MFAVCMVAFPHSEETAKTYALEASSDTIDFTTDQKVHTAADGIAVVGAQKPAVLSAEADEPAPLSEVTRFTADPNTIWQDEASPTHSGFTMPVAMSADSDSIGILSIPDLGLSVNIYESADQMEDMTKGAAHFKHTSAWEGNIGLSAHNVNFDGSAGYFLNLYTLKNGAVIRYETALGSREYLVSSITEIPETDWSSLARTADNRITLITCITGKPNMRLCVQAVEKSAS
ncbi:class D sortase [Ruminococcaceae bacterium OttesenSCG-928-L11]|nr:class D sortase [Ruminococcaceae bacterium OttesenSCG-928-L11]